MKILLDPSAEGGNPPSSSPATDSPALTSPPPTFSAAEGDVNRTMQTSGGPTVPVQKAPEMPESMKGTIFSLDDEDVGDLKKQETKVSPELNKEIKLEKKEPEVLKVDEKKGLKIDTFKDQKKVEVTPEEEKVLTQNQKDELQKHGKRDFSIFPDEIKDELKNTSRKSFDFITKTYKEFQEVKATKDKVEGELKNIQSGGFPSSWYEHPESWRLHPGAQRELGRLDRLGAEEDFWREQMSNIDNGRKFRLLKGWDKQTGQLVPGEEIEPSQEAKNEIFLKLGAYQSEKTRTAIGLNQFAQTFSSKAGGFVKGVEDIIEKEWPWHKDDKHEAQKWVKEFMGELPPEIHNQLGFKVASLLYATYMKTNELLISEMEKNKNTKTVTQSKSLAEPSLRSPSAGEAQKSRVGGNGTYTPPAVFDLNGM